MINVGLVGFGYWGPNIARNICEIEGLNLDIICDSKSKRLKIAKQRFKNCQTTSDINILINDKTLHAIFIATPPDTHYSLAKRVLLAKKHVFIEKPLTTNSSEALELCQIAKRLGLTIMVDHTFLYTGAVEKIHEVIQSGELGEILYVDSVRINLGLFQQDSNVIWDLTPHDLSIFLFILEKRPTHISAVGAAHLLAHENISYLTLLFEGETIGHIHVNWMSPVKIRKMMIGGSKKMVIYDDVEPSEKVKIYNTSAHLKENPYEMFVQYRTGDVQIPKLDTTEALRKEIIDFRDSILKSKPTRSSGEFGTDVTKIIEAAEISLKTNCALIEIPWE